MATAELVVVSDSHLSVRTPEATNNWHRVLDHVSRMSPDLVVHTGDISLDGADDPADLEHAHRLLQLSPAQVIALPGNHDLGDNPCESNRDSDRLITSERLAGYRAVLGPDRWRVDVCSWRLIGFNAQLMGSGLVAEAEQWEWLMTEARQAAQTDRHVAWFSHKPMLHSDPHPPEHDVAIRYLRPEPRQRLFEILRTSRARLFISGHVHQHHRVRARDVDHVWAPTSWATLSPADQSTVGERWVGVLELRLAADGSYQVHQVRLDDDCQHVIGETIPNPYDH